MGSIQKGSGGHTTDNFRNLSSTKEGDIVEKLTIEFRPQSATVDPVEAHLGVRFLLAMNLAGQAAPVAMKRICQG